MKRFMAIAAIGFLLFSTQTLFAYVPINYERRNELLQEFKYTPVVNVTSSLKIGCRGEAFEYTTTYPQRETPLSIKAKTYIPTTKNSPVVFMLPSLGGTNQLDQTLAESFCKQNIAAILITTSFIGSNGDALVPVGDHDHALRRVVSALKGALVASQNLEQINKEKIGLFGISLGGILGSVAYGVMPEISAATFVVNGGDIPFIMAYSDQPTMIKLRQARMQEQNLKTIKEYELYLRDHLTLDPLHFAKTSDAKNTKLFLSKTDNSVPSETQLQYYTSMGSPTETTFYSMAHAATIFAVLGPTSSHKAKIVQWFATRFENPNSR